MYMIQYKHAKLLRQCVLFWPRNRLSMAIRGYFVYVCRHVGLHRQSNCTYILAMPCEDNISAWNHLILQPIID